MIDPEQKNHDLAITAAAISAYMNFNSEVRGETPAEKRISFADYLQDEYEYFLKYYMAKSK